MVIIILCRVACVDHHASIFKAFFNFKFLRISFHHLVFCVFEGWLNIFFHNVMHLIKSVYVTTWTKKIICILRGKGTPWRTSKLTRFYQCQFWQLWIKSSPRSVPGMVREIDSIDLSSEGSQVRATMKRNLKEPNIKWNFSLHKRYT